MSDCEPVCFTCGLSTTAETLENRLADGTLCPSCQNRLLAAQPPLLPSFSFDSDVEALDSELSISVELEDPEDPTCA